MSDLIVSSQWDIVNTSLDTNYQEITYSRAIRGYLINSRGETDILMKKTDAATDYKTIKAGGERPMNLYMPASSNSLGWFRVATGTDVAEIMVFY